ncbi:MAG: hypothetical protein JSV30_06190 [Candidatus Omnitrophota bacterium]|nr:MAG: hypothetical protein JSV30_06190 [Candidatus Omnitrophota bacterium]
MGKLISSKRAQAVLEYAVVLGIVALALGMMQVYLMRGIQAGVKIAADEIGLQEDSVELSVELNSAKELDSAKEFDVAEVNKQRSVVRSESASTHTITHGAGGGQTAAETYSNEIIKVDETNPSCSKSWYGWRKKHEKPDEAETSLTVLGPGGSPDTPFSGEAYSPDKEYGE